MANGGSIRYSVGFDVNSADLNQLKASLQAIQKQASQVSGTGKLQKEFKEASDAAKKLEQILNSSWNSKLQQFNLDKVNQGINQTYGSVKQLKAEMEKGGAAGTAAFNQIASAMLNTNLQLKQSSKLLDDMATSFANTVKWGISSSIFNSMTSSIQKAWSFTKNLDSSLNDIRIVTDQSAESMEEFAVSANKAAKELGASTLDYTNAALIYYQQGLSAEEVNARAETTLKAANVTGQRGEEVSEQLTAVWNGYKVTAEEAELYVDKLAAVAAKTASDLQELSVGMSKVASAANLMGVDVDQLNAQLATIVSITRQAPESVGTALKTIYARMGDIEAGLDGETSLDSYTEKMAQMGYNVLDANGKLRDMGEVITEIGENWQNMSREQQLALSQTVAGTRQYNNLLALFDNWDMYTDALNTSAHAAGTLQKQQDIYMESTEAHLKTLRAETQRTYDLLVDTESINPIIDLFTDALGGVNDFIEGLGGGTTALVYFGSVAANIFNKQIGEGISRQINNIKVLKENLSALKAKGDWAQVILGPSEATAQTKQNVQLQHEAKGDGALSLSALEKEATYAQKTLNIQKALTQEEYAQFTAAQQEIGIKEREIEYLEQYKNIAINVLDVENATLKTFQERLQIEQSALDKESDSLEQLERSFRLYQEGVDMFGFNDLSQEIYEVESALDSVFTEQHKMQLNQEELNALDNINSAILEGQEIQEKDINIVLEAQKRIREDQIRQVELIKQGIAGKIAAENGTTEALKREQAAREKILQQQQAEKEKQLQIQKAIQLATGGIQAATAIVGALNTGLDESATGAEKLNASFAGLSGAAAGIANMFAPGSGILIQGIFELGKGILKLTGLWEDLENLFKSTEERLEELNTRQKELINTAQEYTSSKKALEEIVDEYEQLADKAGDYDKTIHNLTDAERERYNELKDTLLQYNQDALLGYNAEGEAIIKKNQGIQETIDLLKEEYEQKIKNQFVENWNDTNATKEKQITDAEKKVTFAESNLEGIQSSASKQNIEAVAKTVQQQAYSEIVSVQNIFDQSNEDIQAAFTDLSAAMEKGITEKDISKFIDVIDDTDTAQTQNVLDAAFRIKDSLSAYQNAVNSANDSLTQAQLELQNVQRLDSNHIFNTIKYIEKYSAEWTQLESLGVAGVENVVTQYIDSLELGQNGINSYEDAFAAAQSFSQSLYDVLSQIQDPEAWLSDIQNFDIYDFGTLEEYNTNVLNKVNTIVEQNKEAFANMDEEQKRAFFEAMFGFTNIDFNDAGYATSIENPFKDNPALFYQGKAENAKKQVAELEVAISYVNSGEPLEEEQAQALEQLKVKYEELAQIQDVNSHEYLATLRQIREQEEDNAKQALENQKKLQEEKLEQLHQDITRKEEDYQTALALGDKDTANELLIQLEADVTEFEKTMDELQNADYSLKMQIDADLASDVDDAFGLADELGNLQELIGEDLTLTFEEAQNIIKQGYGEILQGAKETTEQTIVLNKEQVNSYIEGKEAEIQADKEAKIEQLEAQKESLLAQKQALTAKLAALKKAAEAENAVDAATALAEAQREEANYQAEVKKLEALLKNESESAIETEKIDEELYNALGGMYETDSKNQQQAEVDATNTNKAEIDKRIQNVHALHTAYQNLAKQVKAAETGDTVEIGNETTVGGGDIINTQSETVKGQGDYTYGALTQEDLSEYFKNNQVDEAYKNTINALIDATQTEIDGLDNQLGAIDAGIAALKSAGSSLNKYQKDLATKKDGSGKDKQDMDLVKDKVDIYHDLNLELKNLSNAMDKLGKQEKKLFGQQLIDNLNEQLGVLQAQTAVYKEKIKLAQKEASMYRGNLASQGINFDAQGNVTNYVAAMKGKQDYLNGLISKYNSMSETEQKNFKSTVEQAKKDYEQFKKDMEYYENLVSETIPDLEAQIQDAMDKQIEIQIQKFTMEVEIRLEMAEAERDWNEFKKKIIDDIDDDDILGNAMAKMLDFDSYYKDSGKGAVQALTKQVNGTLDQLHQIDETGTSSVYGDNKAQAMEDLQKYYTELMQQLEDVKDLQDEIKDAYLDMIDEANEKFDAQIEKYETITELIEHNMNVVELLNGDDAYDQLAKYYELQERNNLKQLDFHRQEVAFWRERMDSVEEGSEEWDAYRENWQEAVNELNESVSASIENLIAKYQNTVSGIFEDLNDKVTGGKGLDYVKEEWDLINKNADQYLDTINSAFAIRELEGKYLDALDNTDSISAQRQLNDMMNEQLNMLRAKDKLTQYDVDRANALYEIELKKIALQEAQQNKSQMRLRRDAQGNYSYQYVADQDAIGNAEDELASAQNSLYNMDKEQYRTNLDEIYEMYVEFQDKLNELYMDNTLSDIEREEQKKLLVEQYGELINGLVEQNEDIRLNLQESALQAYADFQGELLMEDIVPQWDSSVQEMADKFAGEGGFIPTCQDSLIELDEATADYEDSLEDLEDTAGISFDEIEDGLDKNIDLTYDFIDANDELIDKYGDQLNAIEEVWHEVQVLAQKYEEAERAAIRATEAAYKYWQTAKAMAADGIDGGPSYSGGLGTSGYSKDNSTYTSSSNTGDKNTTDTTSTSKKPAATNEPYYQITGGNGSWKGIGSDGAHWLSSNDLSKLKSVAKHWYSKFSLNGGKISSLATGGYTGSWANGDKDGRLAFLHQKELVLNSEDTKNILSAVDIVRSIGASMRDRINSLTSKFNNNNNIANNGMVIEQKVSIDARFEGQTESSQIETALINLVNYASQHAYDTTR